MPKALIFALLFAGLPVAAYADEAGGAVGAIVRAPGETAAGIVGGLTGTEAPRFHHYIREHNVPSYTWAEHPRVVVGDVLPPEGVILHPVPHEYGVSRYQYTVVDDTPVLVDPATRRIVEVVP
jgi:hypothetical protein